MLLFQDAFILDHGGIRIYVWIGKKADKEEKLNAMKIAVVSLCVILMLIHQYSLDC